MLNPLRRVQVSLQQQEYQVHIKSKPVSRFNRLQPLQSRHLLLPSSQHLIERVFTDGSSAGGRRRTVRKHGNHHCHHSAGESLNVTHLMLLIHSSFSSAVGAEIL